MIDLKGIKGKFFDMVFHSQFLQFFLEFRIGGEHDLRLIFDNDIRFLSQF